MSKIIATLALFAAMSLHASEELQFGDVNYFLKTNQLNFVSNWSQPTQKFTPGNNPALLKRGYQIDSAFGYAFTDRFNMYVGVSYRFEDYTQVLDTTPKVRSFRMNGFSNPSLAANYRLYNQDELPFNLDFGLVGTFNVQDQKIGSHDIPARTSYDGNNADARNSYEANVRIGNKWDEANEWQLAGGLIYWQPGTATLEASSNSKLHYKSSWDQYLRATYQYRPVNEFMVLLSAQGNRAGDGKYTNQGTNYTNQQHIDLDFRFTVKYLITENFVAKFNYGQSRNSDYTRSVSGASNLDIQKRRANFWGLGVDFLF